MLTPEWNNNEILPIARIWQILRINSVLNVKIRIGNAQDYDEK